MKNYLPILEYFLGCSITTKILEVLIATNLYFYKASVFASFPFYIISRNFYHKNNLYNFIHNKTINI